MGGRTERAMIALLAITVLASACKSDDPTTPVVAVPTEASAARAAPKTDAKVAFGLELGPGNLTITPDDAFITSLHQFYAPPRVLAEILDRGKRGTLLDYPRPGEGVMPNMAAVLGIRSDTAGILYILDNGNAAMAPPKIVVWDSNNDRLVRTISLASVVVPMSFVNDLAFDYKRNQLYLSDPADGQRAALIVVDLASGQARRVLEGDKSVIAEPISLVVEGHTPRRRMRDGSVEPVRMGVDGIGIDYDHEWVYFGPLQGTSMYRIRAPDLANPAMGQSLGGAVEFYAHKPPSDGIALDEAGNIYLGDLPGNAIGVITTDRSYRQLVQGAEYKWMDDFEFSPDGWLYVVSTQLHLSPELNAGVREAMPPFQVFRMRPLARGRQGY